MNDEDPPNSLAVEFMEKLNMHKLAARQIASVALNWFDRSQAFVVVDSDEVFKNYPLPWGLGDSPENGDAITVYDRDGDPVMIDVECSKDVLVALLRILNSMVFPKRDD